MMIIKQRRNYEMNNNTHAMQTLYMCYALFTESDYLTIELNFYIFKLKITNFNVKHINL